MKCETYNMYRIEMISRSNINFVFHMQLRSIYRVSINKSDDTNRYTKLLNSKFK